MSTSSIWYLSLIPLSSSSSSLLLASPPNPILSPVKFPSLTVTTSLKRTVFVSCEQRKESAFLDENGGIVKDMDNYLNNLSLEYDSVWDTKPSWCQPWTIALTGVLAVAISWLILHSVVVTALISSLICAWWYIFLYSYPKAYSDMIAERRKQVTEGVEDTFGRR